MLFSLIYSTIFQAKLLSFLTKNTYEKPIRSFEQLAKSDIPIKLIGVAAMLLQGEQRVILERVEILELTELSNNIDEYYMKAYRERYATLCEDSFIFNHPELFAKMTDPLIVAEIHAGFLMLSHHVLREVFDSEMRIILESGFYQYFLSKYKNLQRLKNRKEFNEATNKRKVSDFSFPFFVLSAGLCLGIFIFILEFAVKYWSRFILICNWW